MSKVSTAKCATGAKAGGGASAAGGVGDDDDDELAFLDSQIRKQRAAEPCYASLLRTTTEVMRDNNPKWAAAQDKVKPSKSRITGAKRDQLQGALERRLVDDEKKRGRALGGKGESK